MRLLSLCILFLLAISAYADEVKVEITPPRPVAGEVFQARFRIFTSSGEEPVINFSPTGLEVVGKSNQGVSTRTVYANGQLTVTREILVAYDLVASKPGTAFMRDITVQVAGQTLRHSSVNITVLKEAEEPADVFVMASVPKTEVFLGEGITVRYYLYSKMQVSALDIKRYPKLNNFLKRFLQEPDRMERVSVNGQYYLRSLIYAAKLFPEKVGELRVDPLSLTATYPTVRGNDPFGGFGLSREMRTRTFESETVKIRVNPLPEPVPSHFSGLIGKHEFNLRVGASKLIVNQPLELGLTINGPGALENLQVPTILSHPGLEEFESTGDLKIIDSETATKTFEYTFLAKSNMDLPASKVVLSYFDPDAGKYVPIELSLPAITVAGGSKSSSPESKADAPPTPDSPRKGGRNSEVTLSGPLSTSEGSFSRYLPYLNFVLSGLALVLALGFFIKSRPSLHLSSTSVPAVFKKGQFPYGEFAKWLAPAIQKTGKTPSQIIKEAGLDEVSQNYFLDLIQAANQRDYSTRKTETLFQYKSAPFKRLAQYIEKIQNEDPTKSA